jgi:hypothetical protein
MTKLMHQFLNIDRLAGRQNSDLILPVAYNISVIDTPRLSMWVPEQRQRRI